MIPRSEMVAHYSLVKDLIDLGVKIPYNHFMWVEKKCALWQVHFPGINQFNPKTMLPAPTADDLLACAPTQTKVFRYRSWRPKPLPEEDMFRAEYGEHFADERNAAGAIARLLILLLTEDIIRLDNVNQRIKLSK